MITLKDLGDFQSIPEIVNDIIHGKVAALEQHFAKGWDIEKNIDIDEDISESPLDYALIMESFESVKWLIAHGVNLNVKDNPAFLKAVRYCNQEIILYLVEHGAKIDEYNKMKAEAFEEALNGRKFENLPLIHQLGHSVQQYGGSAFRKTVAGIGFDQMNKKKPRDEGKYEALDFFIKNQVDINYNQGSSSFSSTPLCLAARYADLTMCRYLVENGADITICEDSGMRPYSIAVERGDLEMAAYFRSLEPEEYHQLQNKLEELKPYKLPKVLLDFLTQRDLHVDLADSDLEWVEFFPLVDTVPMKIGKQKLLRISKTSGDFNHIIILWNPKSKRIAYYDMEHEELQDIATAEEFFQKGIHGLGDL